MTCGDLSILKYMAICTHEQSALDCRKSDNTADASETLELTLFEI